MRRHLLLLTAALLAAGGADLATATAVHGQEYATARRAFAFFGRTLTIEVTADGPGALQVVRGGTGYVEVAAHAPDGLTSFALGGWRGDRLQLNALGASDASFIVVVPENVHVVATLPGQGTAARVPEPPAALRWGWDDAAPAAPQTAAPPIAPEADGLFLVHHAETAPDQFVLHQASLSRVQVRIGGDRFLVRSSQPLALRGSAGAPLRLRTGDQPIALAITVPAGTRSFRLGTDREVLLTVHEGRASTRCDRAVSVRTPTGEEQYEFVPAAGRVHCSAH